MTWRALLLIVAIVALAIPTWIAPGWIGSHLVLRTAEPDAKTIAFSFDDVPRGPGAFYTPEERTRLLIAALRDAGVEQAVFFVNPGRIGPSTGGAARVQAYVDAGHVIGDHSFSHRDLVTMPAASFLADIDRAENWLKGRPGYRPWFRFPGLNQGGHDTLKRQVVLDGLKTRGLTIAAVTVDASDWNLDGLATAAKKAGKPIDEAALAKLYVDTTVRAADFSDAVMRKAIGRSPAHMLLLHETDLAARYLTLLVAALKADGWRVVTADAAYADPVYQTPLPGPANGTLTEALGWEKHIKGPLSYEGADPRVGSHLFAALVAQPTGNAASTGN